MAELIVIGAQWGDEGKGKLVDLLTERADIVVRYHGGNNAGHTLVIDGVKTVLHLLPAGIMREGKQNLVSTYVVVDREVLMSELALARANNAKVTLDPSAPLILPVHIQIDGGRESVAGDDKIGTTVRGIGPCYEDFWSRRGVRLGDLVSEERVRRVLETAGYYAEKQALVSYLGKVPLSLDEMISWCMEHAKEIVRYLGDTRRVVAEARECDYFIAYEGAQGVLLDAIHGTRPFCTSSVCGSTAVDMAFGPPNTDLVDRSVVGVVKAYLTRVGAGPFPTELDNELGERLREAGGEYGATTGRPRRCGWLDLPLLKYACRVGGVTHIAITKLDVLTGLDKIKVCTHYERDDSIVPDSATFDTDMLTNADPKYTELDGWTEDITEYRSYDELPENARAYVRFISEQLGEDIDIALVSVGPDREQIINIDGYLEEWANG